MIIDLPGFNPHFPPEGGFIATNFEFTGGFLDERNTDCISEFRTPPVDSKGKRETVILVKNAGLCHIDTLYSATDCPKSDSVAKHHSMQ